MHAEIEEIILGTEKIAEELIKHFVFTDEDKKNSLKMLANIRSGEKEKGNDNH